jgi:hypothetical protein
MDQLLFKLTERYPHLQLCSGERFYWSPKTKQVFYKDSSTLVYCWKLLHEVGHALLEHQTYNSDLELLALEVAAWEKAQELAQDFKLTINADYIQDCLDVPKLGSLLSAAANTATFGTSNAGQSTVSSKATSVTFFATHSTDTSIKVRTVFLLVG